MSWQRLGGWTGAAAIVGGISLAATQAAFGTDGARGSCPAQWQVVAKPPAALVAVAALSDKEVWAIGVDKGSPAGRRSVIVHWDGAHLELTPETGGTLLGIAAISPSDVWVVGSRLDDQHGLEESGLLEHWDGATWSLQALPEGVGALDDIVMISASAGWAVGTGIGGHPLVLRWDGTSWTRRTFQNHNGWTGRLYSIAASSPNDVWAAGASDGGPMAALVEAYVVHWDGRGWHAVRVPSRAPAFNEFLDVSAVSRTEAWGIHEGETRSDIQHWQGRRWRIVRMFRPALNLHSVTALQGEAWAFGGRSGRAALLHWNGKRWHTSKAPITRLRGSLVAGDALSSQDIWAVGSRLMARYGCLPEQP